MYVDKSQVIDKIAELMASVKGVATTYDESKTAMEKLGALDFSNPDDVAQWQDLAEKARVYNVSSNIDALHETMEMDLMKVETDYVLTDSKSLTSPAGFHPDENVFVQATIAIHTNRPSDHDGIFVDGAGKQLYIHAMNR
tara:strand:- start:664 stop:1083 length:420 start_codon:yes stop_codon:yes gene_type:complete